MRINRYVSIASGISRRKVDILLNNGQIKINDQAAKVGQQVHEKDKVYLNNKLLELPQYTTIMLNKPVGYVVSRNGQGSKTIYNLIPNKFLYLKPIGRLDKNSSGLLLLTNNGELANSLSHPSFSKQKIYIIKTDRKISDKDIKAINKGVKLSDGISHMRISIDKNNSYKIRMHEGKNRQIRRTLDHLGYKIESLHRIKFASFDLSDLQLGSYKEINIDDD